MIGGVLEEVKKKKKEDLDKYIRYVEESRKRINKAEKILFYE